jgi:hypothetical protein
MKIRSSKLTTCDVWPDGSTLALSLLDHSGTPVTLELSLEQAEAVALTLPHLLSRAVKQRTGNDKSRMSSRLMNGRSKRSNITIH